MRGKCSRYQVHMWSLFFGQYTSLQSASLLSSCCLCMCSNDWTTNDAYMRHDPSELSIPMGIYMKH